MSAFSAKRDQAVANDYLANHSACPKCGGHTPHDELSAFGAQCRPCFQAYCAEAPSVQPPPRTKAQRVAVLERLRDLRQAAGGVKGRQAATVARRLRELEAAGHRLTAGQRWVLERCEAKLGIAPAEVQA